MTQQSALPDRAGVDSPSSRKAGARGPRAGPFTTRARTLLSLTGPLDTPSAGDFELQVHKHAEAAHRLGHPLIVDLTHVTRLSGAAAAALDAAARHEEGACVAAVVPDLHMRAVLALLSQVTLHPTLAEAVADAAQVAATAPAS